VAKGEISESELDEHVRHILYAEFVSGIVDDPGKKSVIDPVAGANISQGLAEESMVLLKNEQHVLPLNPASTQSIAVIGLHADVGMISGGGSAQVDPPGGNAIMPPGKRATTWMGHIWFPTSPLAALRAALPHATIRFASGDDPAAAAKLAKESDVAIVFASQWESEAMDLPTLGLPGHQDVLIRAVAQANPHTAVVMETGTATLMPWIDNVAAVVEAWYAGTNGAQAVARVLTGEVNPSGRLPITFPKADSDLPQPKLTSPPPASTADFYGTTGEAHERTGLPPFDVTYAEGRLVGYKWYKAKGKQVLFPFGYGLSYTTFAYSDLQLAPDGRSARLTVTNTGAIAGRTVAELYASLPTTVGEPERLAGWASITLKPNESREVIVPIEPLTLAVFDTQRKTFSIPDGQYTFRAGASVADLRLAKAVMLTGRTLAR
jgi:beta-glucosidase